VSAKRSRKGAPPERPDRRRLARLYRAFGREYRPHVRALAWAFTGLSLSTVTALLLPWPLKMVLDHVVLAHPLPAGAGWLSRWAHGDALALLLVLSLAYLALRLLDSLFTFVHRVGFMVVAQKMATAIRERLFATLQRLSLSFHGSTRAGDLVLRLLSDVSDIKVVLVEVPQTVALHALLLVTHVTLMCLLDWRLALIAFAAIPPMVLYNRHVGANIEAAAKERRSKEGEVAALVSENVTAMALVQAYGREDLLHERFQSANRASLALGLRSMKLSKAFKRVSDLLVAAGTGAVLWVGGRLALQHEVSPGTIVLFAAYLRNLYAPIDKLATTLLDAAGATASGERLLEVLESDLVVPEAEGAIEVSTLRGRVEFERVTFGYRSGEPVLRDVSFTVEPGETIAIVGHNGAGKSTLLSLLLRFHDPQSGHVRLDGCDLRELKLDSVRRQIAVVMQESRLFQKSVRENIRFGREGATDAEVELAAKLAQAHEFVLDMPQGYDTLVREGGESLSGGERQRINIARAIVRDAPLVILDEPSTALDARTEAAVRGAMRALTRGRTTLVVAHAAATWRAADRILVLSGGRVAGFGTHEELARSCPPYRELNDVAADDAFEVRA
jgi:ATP-binding cassette subfamily B protein